MASHAIYLTDHEIVSVSVMATDKPGERSVFIDIGETLNQTTLCVSEDTMNRICSKWMHAIRTQINQGEK